ncbi:hypothetical protein GOP47_0011398 [Adiantum capillus-veneris]|uniref:Helicase ATP-binding domain-containing protein n=1 Tax=Adiantum capillus-veneris TaxID=13818 RepID=A0A9D4UT65_ADICA|nr:hypothetical protein GOP47_0011398 [Adiantum capillus-veneris]
MASAAREHEFPAFPFEPYPVQLQLMRAVYSALEKGGVAIVESPTGTGKTLSLICSVLQWLQDQQQSAEDQCRRQGVSSVGLSNDEPDWMRDFAPVTDRKIPIKHEAKGSTARLFKDGKKFLFAQDLKVQKKQRLVSSMSANNEDDFLLEDYESDDGSNADGKKQKDLANESTDDGSDEEAESEKPLKVFFCSRTHSQLSQFVRELQRTSFSTALKTVPIGARKSLCINPEVSKLKHSFRINERCLELQRARDSRLSGEKVLVNEGKQAKKKPGGCPMMSKNSRQKVFRELVWESEVMDIEDMVKLGESIGTCPYYASRRMVPMADLVVLPYQSILHCPTREATGLKLKGCVVVIDEAHNLVDSISSMYSCQISGIQLKQVLSLLTTYLSKFRERLGAGNRRYIQTLLLLIEALSNQIATYVDVAEVSQHDVHCDPMSGTNRGKKTGDVLTINDFLFSLNIDNINMFKLWQYMKESNIVHKVSSYAEQSSSFDNRVQSVNQEPEKAAPTIAGTITSFHALAELILALMNADSDGRVLIVPSSCSFGNDGEQRVGHIKFVMLNAARAFMEVIDQAHAVILAGGTLQPVEELRYRLFPHLQESRIHTFVCGHIVPTENVLALAVARGPTGRTFDFTYQSRSLPETMEELGRLLFNLCCIVPEGVVVFLPSFEYEQQLYSAWQLTGILDKLQKKKALFREPRDAALVELTLQEYREIVSGAVRSSPGRTGAVLLCIVGGKMSEGINFNDGMGRCVVMVGLPYPSPSDPELVERMRFIDQLARFPSNSIQSSKLLTSHSSVYSGRDYYENLCMKAVNQSIGRAIRHIEDYASILLVDARYTASTYSSAPSRQASKLPSWIKNRLVNVTGNFGEVQKLLHQFFKAKTEKDLAQTPPL